MDHDYIDIDLQIRQAQQLRDKAIGKLLCTEWQKLRHVLASLSYPRIKPDAAPLDSSVLAVRHFLP